MGKDKSKIKHIIREHFAAAVTPMLPATVHARDEMVRAFVVDGAILFSSLNASMLETDALDKFQRVLDRGFLRWPRAHTAVLVFDSKQYVPSRKGGTQADRKAALVAALDKKHVPPWAWDGGRIIIGAARPLPPWERVRLNPAAYDRAQRDIIQWVMERYIPPAHTRLLVDYADGVYVVESTSERCVFDPYPDFVPKPAIGEADITVQWYVRRWRVDEPAPLAVREHARPHYWNAPLPLNGTRRAVYEAGDVVGFTTDTDFLPLCLVANADNSTPHRPLVWLNTPYEDAAAELYDIHELQAAIRPERMWAFVAFCSACGNDYVTRLPGFSHKSLFCAYEELAVAMSPTGVPTLVAPAFVKFIQVACAAKQKSVPSEAALVAYHEQVAWSLLYSAVGVRGADHVPP